MPENKTKPLPEWLKEIPIDDLINDNADMQIIAESCGKEVLLSLMVNLSSMGFYISTRPLTEAKKRYIRKHYGPMTAKELARLLDVSDRFVFEAASTTDEHDGRQHKLFGKEGADNE